MHSCLQVSRWRARFEEVCSGQPEDFAKLLACLKKVGHPAATASRSTQPQVMVAFAQQGQSKADAAAAAMDASLSVQGIGQVLLGHAAGQVGSWSCLRWMHYKTVP